MAFNSFLQEVKDVVQERVEKLSDKIESCELAKQAEHRTMHRPVGKEYDKSLAFLEKENTMEKKNLFEKSDKTVSEITKEKEHPSDKSESEIDKKDKMLEDIKEKIGTTEGLKELMERNPEKVELWKKWLETIKVLEDPDASPAEIRNAILKLSKLKGEILETAVKDTFKDAGLDVEAMQRIVEGEEGGTKPDIIAKNNTDSVIIVLGETIQQGETICVECKCGRANYIESQLIDHIPNQLSGQIGTKILLTTSDVNDVERGLAENVCETYGAKLKSLDVSVADIEAAIKEVAD